MIPASVLHAHIYCSQYHQGELILWHGGGGGEEGLGSRSSFFPLGIVLPLLSIRLPPPHYMCPTPPLK